jgi:peptide/nickel transport system ATP-binding protein/oligopeptide transport system ATP-binding protein
MEKLLELKDVSVIFKKNTRKIKAVNRVSLSVKKGEILGLAGESGSGKSVTAMSIAGLINDSKKTSISGKIFLNGEDLRKKKNDELRKLRSQKMAMIFQDPINSLNPVFTVGHQIAEVFRIQKKMDKKQAWAESLEMLKKVEIPSPSFAARQYPHQFSGGMCQRVMIAMALSGNPDLIIADEPTTALAVTIQAQILGLLYEFHQKTNTSILFITHDLGIVAQFCHSIAIILEGEIVEKGLVTDIFMNPLHPYTQGLLQSIPVIGKKKRLEPMPPRLTMDSSPLHGCKFNNRCYRKHKQCEREKPGFIEPDPGHFVRCFNKRSGQQ